MNRPDPGPPRGTDDDRRPDGDAAATGDIVIDSALRDLADVAPEDLDGHIEAAQALHRTLQGRLADLGE